MKIGVIGAGFTGLAAAYELVKQGHQVTIFEKDNEPGGLAIGYKEKEWDWTLEQHYHHWFTNDKAVLNLAKETSYPVVIKRPHTNWFINGNIYEFDSVKAALSMPLLSPSKKLRNLVTLGILRVNPFWKPLEKVNAHKVLPKMMGKSTYELLWEPLFINKFGDYAKNISLAWFWARIKKRTPALAYPEGGFLAFAKHMVTKVEEKGGTVLFGTDVYEISEGKNQTIVKVKRKNGKINVDTFDKVIVTLPSFLFLKITPQLPSSYRNKLVQLQGIGATNLVLRLKKPFFKDNTYWLSIAQSNAPVMAIVEHTNFMDKKNYNNEHLVYLGNYLDRNHPNFIKNKEELLKLYHPFLKEINPRYIENLIDYQVFKAPFAQPIIPTNYSKKIPPTTTPLKNVYLSNIEQVYPWDRGTNYAVELGQKVASLILK